MGTQQAAGLSLSPPWLLRLQAALPTSPMPTAHAHPMRCAALQATLRETISLLLLLLLDERGLVNYEEGSTLMKAINVLMLKVG